MALFWGPHPGKLAMQNFQPLRLQPQGFNPSPMVALPTVPQVEEWLLLS